MIFCFIICDHHQHNLSFFSFQTEIEEENDTSTTTDHVAKAMSTILNLDEASAETSKPKAKHQKHVKGKSSKSSSRRNSKQASRPRSFLEQNIKKAGSTVQRRQSFIPADTSDTSNEPMVNLNAYNGVKSIKSNSIDISVMKRTKNHSVRKAISKEQIALNSAYICLTEELKIRRELRKNISVKIGRANDKLKSLLEKHKFGDVKNQSPTQALISLIAKQKTNQYEKPTRAKQHRRESRGAIKIQNYDDPDRI